MAQDRFTKEEAKSVIEALTEIMKAFPKSKARDFIWHFNDLFLFLADAEKSAPKAR